MRLLVLLLLLCGCGLPLETVQSDLHYVRLDLSPTADFREGFRLELWPAAPGAFCEGQIFTGAEVRRVHQSLSADEFATLVRCLNQEGVAALQDGDCGDPEEEVLYTRLQVNWQGRDRVSHWRGLPPPQARVADALLSSPLAPTLRQGLDAVQELKRGTAR